MSNTEESREKQQEVSEYSIFLPRSTRSLYVDYPELKKHESLKVLNNRQLLFCWYYACEASPFFKISNPHLRAEKSAEKSHSVGKKIAYQTEYNDIIGLNFPSKITAGIKTMEGFKIGPRIRAKMIYEKSFQNIEKILDIDASNEENFVNKDGEADQTKKKAYVDTVSSAVKIIPELIERLEGSLGLTSKKKADEEEGISSEGSSFMDEYHESN